MFAVCVYMHVLFYVCVGVAFVDLFEKGFINEKFLIVCLLMTQFDRPVDGTLKSYYLLTN